MGDVEEAGNAVREGAGSGPLEGEGQVVGRHGQKLVELREFKVRPGGGGGRRGRGHLKGAC